MALVVRVPRSGTTRARQPVGVFATGAPPAAARAPLNERGVEVIEVAADPSGRVDIAAAARELGKRGLTRVLIEGGGAIAAAFLKANLVDRLSLYHGGRALRADTRSPGGPLSLPKLAFAPPV